MYDTNLISRRVFRFFKIYSGHFPMDYSRAIFIVRPASLLRHDILASVKLSKD